MSASDPSIHRVHAFNTAAASENKIHDDRIASRFGFEGGLVPGVAVFGYLAHLPVARWGRDWLERGQADCRFGKPVYDGRIAEARAVDHGDRLEMTVTSEGALCATGSARLPEHAPMPAGKALADAFPGAVPPAQRPPASETSLAEGGVFGIAPVALTREYSEQWIDDMRETDPIFRTQGLAHPGLLLRLANWVLTQNVVLGPWIHSGSQVQNHAAMPVGCELHARGIVRRNHEHKGHRFVELDVLVLIDGRTPAARIAHTAIWRPRQVAEAGA